MRGGGVEPPRVTPPEPKSGASASFATHALLETSGELGSINRFFPKKQGPILTSATTNVNLRGPEYKEKPGQKIARMGYSHCRYII